MDRLIIVTNTGNREAAAEDEALARLLLPYFETEVADFFDDGIFAKEGHFLIRNIWGDPRSRKRFAEACKKFDDQGIEYRNSSNGKGDQLGKMYLPELYRRGYPVIPTFSDPEEAAGRKENVYMLKPVFGENSEGIRILPAENVAESFVPEIHLIQPKMIFSHELSFFFVDGKFCHALRTNGSRWDLTVYIPDEKEISVAQRFADWNPIRGLQRIDFLKTEDRIVLLEIEDQCPYLSLLDVPGYPAQRLAEALALSFKPYGG